jgi:hypothetical protein
MTSEALVSAACPKIRDMGWAFYFDPATMAFGQRLGLDGFQFYFLGRGGVLGDVEPSVVASAFGYFNPALVEQMWNSGRTIISPREAGRAYMACGAQFGRAKFGDVAGLEEFCDAAGAVNDAADPVGLALYSGLRAEQLEDDPPARAMQLVTVLREFRGSAHLLAVRASGLDAKTAHFLRRPNDIGMFGWGPEDAPPITDEERVQLDAADELTDRLVLPAYAVLDEEGGQALLDGLEALEAALAG